MARNAEEHLARGFPTTRHSALTAVREGDPEARRRALSALATAYWRPVYGYLRLHWRKPHEEAADLTQDFFAHALEKDLLARFDPERARLRTFLRACVDRVAAEDGAVLGTPGFMAPEQAAGQSGTADARADVFSLGALLQ